MCFLQQLCYFKNVLCYDNKTKKKSLRNTKNANWTQCYGQLIGDNYNYLYNQNNTFQFINTRYMKRHCILQSWGMRMNGLLNIWRIMRISMIFWVKWSLRVMRCFWVHCIGCGLGLLVIPFLLWMLLLVILILLRLPTGTCANVGGSSVSIWWVIC